MEPSDPSPDSKISIEDIIDTPELFQMIQDQIPDVGDRQAMAVTSKQFQQLQSGLFDSDTERRPHVAKGRIKLMENDVEEPWASMSASDILRHPNFYRRWLLRIDYSKMDLSFLMFWIDPKSKLDHREDGRFGLFSGDIWMAQAELRKLEKYYSVRGFDSEITNLMQQREQAYAEKNVDKFVQCCEDYAIALYTTKRNVYLKKYDDEEIALAAAWLSPRLTVKMRKVLRLLFAAAGCGAFRDAELRLQPTLEWKSRVQKRLFTELGEHIRGITEDLLRWRFGNEAVDSMQLTARWVEPAVLADAIMNPEDYHQGILRLDVLYPDIAAKVFIAIVLECQESHARFDPKPLDPDFFPFIANKIRQMRQDTIRRGLTRMVTVTEGKIPEPYQTIWNVLLLYYNLIPAADWDEVANMVETRFVKALPPAKRCIVM